MKIAVCDDELCEIDKICKLLDRYRNERSAVLAYRTFGSGIDMLESTRGGGFSLYLLDILMPSMSGMDAAKEIRSFDSDAKIVFLTSSPEFAVESYLVKAKDYILKPVDENRLFALLDELYAEIQSIPEGIMVKTRSGIMNILFSRLSCVEVMNKTLYFHLSDGSIREAHAKLSEFEEILLSRPEFVKVHRSFIVNLYQINEMSSGWVTTHQGLSVPVSRALYTMVRSDYMNLMFMDDK